MDLLDDTAGSNAHEFTVSELSGAVKRNIEEQFGRVRVRGEVGRVSRPSSGHLYFDLKDDRSVLAAVSWKGQVAKLQQRPEEGLEVVATGRMTTFPGQSKYQLIVDEIEPAGAGALMAMLEKRRKALAAEGLFDDARKRKLPFLPEVIGVVTSPSGAVIRDILHRLRERFPSHVIIWPVAVQGAASAPQVAAAIRGFNALPAGGGIARPDLIIVARGGGSLEDLWGFNEEVVVRAAADSKIPLISAVGHETDTTLIDFAADRRAPTPTAAAEISVPVRAELAARLSENASRMMRASSARHSHARQRLRDLARALGRPNSLTEPARQGLDQWSGRFDTAMTAYLTRQRQLVMLRPVPVALLRGFTQKKRHDLERAATRFQVVQDHQGERRRDRVAQFGARLESSLRRVTSETHRLLDRQSTDLARLSTRLSEVMRRQNLQRREHVARLDRMMASLGYEQTLKRGFAVIRLGKAVVTSADAAKSLSQFEIEFADGRIAAEPIKPKQGSLF